jgi:hypothetical protein
MIDLTLKIRTANVPVNLPHKTRSLEIEELVKYLEVSMVGTGSRKFISEGAQVPNPDETGNVWFKKASNGAPVGIYSFVGGVWTPWPGSPAYTP